MKFTKTKKGYILRLLKGKDYGADINIQGEKVSHE